jgi:hypothetical protein
LVLKEVEEWGDLDSLPSLVENEDGDEDDDDDQDDELDEDGDTWDFLEPTSLGKMVKNMLLTFEFLLLPLDL